MELTFKPNSISEYFDDELDNLLTKFENFIIHPKCYPIINLNLNLVKLCIPYSINATDNKRHKFST